MSDLRPRPPKTPEERLSEVLNLRLTVAEYDAVCRAAIIRGWTVSEYVRVKLGLRCKTEGLEALN